MILNKKTDEKGFCWIFMWLYFYFFQLSCLDLRCETKKNWKLGSIIGGVNYSRKKTFKKLEGSIIHIQLVWKYNECIHRIKRVFVTWVSGVLFIAVVLFRPEVVESEGIIGENSWGRLGCLRSSKVQEDWGVWGFGEDGRDANLCRFSDFCWQVKSKCKCFGLVFAHPEEEAPEEEAQGTPTSPSTYVMRSAEPSGTGFIKAQSRTSMSEGQAQKAEDLMQQVQNLARMDSHSDEEEES